MGTKMNQSARRALDLINKAYQIEAMITCALFLLLVLGFFGYVLYRGWLHYHLQ